jgi:hypothetical protein
MPLEDVADDYFDLVIAKDVLEHVPMFALQYLTGQLRRMSQTMFVTVPFCEDGMFKNAADERDITHISRLSEGEWKNVLKGNPKYLREEKDLCKLIKQDKAIGTLCYIIGASP